MQLIEWILLNFSWNLQCKRKVFNIFKMPINFFYTRFILWKSNTMLKSRRFWIFRSTFLIQNKTNKHHHQVSIFELGRKLCFFQHGQFFLGTKFHLIQRFSNFWNKLSKSYFRTKTGQMDITLHIHHIWINLSIKFILNRWFNQVWLKRVFPVQRRTNEHYHWTSIVGLV